MFKPSAALGVGTGTSTETACAQFANPLFFFVSYLVQGLWCQGLERLDLCFFSLERLLRRHCPSLRQHLSDEGVELSMFTSRWFVTLFTSTDVFGRGTSRKVRGCSAIVAGTGYTLIALIVALWPSTCTCTRCARTLAVIEVVVVGHV